MSQTAPSDRGEAAPPRAAPARGGESTSGRQGLLPGDDQLVVATALLVALIALAGGWLAAGGPRGRLVEIDAAPPLPVDFEVDLNRADWPELALLPGVGETMARRIVESRETAGPFIRRDDLCRVHGVGPTLLARVKPYLRPLAADGAVAAR